MTLLFALVIAILFGAGAYLMLTRDLYRIVAGVILISNAANLFLMAAAQSVGEAPIHPLPNEFQQISDPLVQALTLTAIVITFAVTALLASLLVRVYQSHDSIDMEDLTEAEIQEEQWRKQEAEAE